MCTILICCFLAIQTLLLLLMLLFRYVCVCVHVFCHLFYGTDDLERDLRFVRYARFCGRSRIFVLIAVAVGVAAHNLNVNSNAVVYTNCINFFLLSLLLCYYNSLCAHLPNSFLSFFLFFFFYSFSTLNFFSTFSSLDIIQSFFSLFLPFPICFFFFLLEIFLGPMIIGTVVSLVCQCAHNMFKWN